MPNFAPPPVKNTIKCNFCGVEKEKSTANFRRSGDRWQRVCIHCAPDQRLTFKYRELVRERGIEELQARIAQFLHWVEIGTRVLREFKCPHCKGNTAECGGRTFEREFECPNCGTTWTDTWCCACNDRCPYCDTECEPVDSEEC